MRRRDNGVDFAREGSLDRGTGKGERGSSARGRGGAEVESGQILLRAIEHVEAIVRPIRIPDPSDRTDAGLEAAGPRVPLDHAKIADHDRAADIAHDGIECGPETDLRPDTRRVARGDGNFRFVAHNLGAPVLCIDCSRGGQAPSTAKA